MGTADMADAFSLMEHGELQSLVKKLKRFIPELQIGGSKEQLLDTVYGAIDNALPFIEIRQGRVVMRVDTANPGRSATGDADEPDHKVGFITPLLQYIYPHLAHEEKI